MRDPDPKPEDVTEDENPNPDETSDDGLGTEAEDDGSTVDHGEDD